MSIFPRPLKKVLDKIVPFSLDDLIPTFNLGTGTADNTTFLRGDGTWATPSSTSGGIQHGTASGTDTYTTTLTGVSSYSDGDAYLIRFTTGNTTGCTLNINGLGAKTLYRNNDGALIGGDIVDGGEMLCIYNSTLNGFQTIGTAPNTLLAYVTNAESITITKGQPVYAYGGTGDRLKVKLAYNTGDSTSAQTVGMVVSTSIAANQKGLIMVNGLLDGLNTLPTSTFADGDPVYLGATAGTITNVKPTAPNHLVYLGFVTTASPGSAGRMYVRVQNGYEMDELHDVQVGSYGTKDVLWRDTATNLWKNKDIFTLIGAASSSANGYLTSTDWSTFNSKQDALISGTNIKTINGSSVLGSGNLVVTGSGVPYTGATSDVQLGNHNLTTNNGSYNSAVQPTTIGVQNNAGTIYGIIEYNKVEISDTVLGNTMLIESTGITYPDLTVQTSAGITSVTGTSPISSTGGLTPVISIANASADGSTKGAATFNASDFNSSSGLISIDYTNGQTASSSNKGFLSSTDWNTFNGKQAALGFTPPPNTRSISTTSPLSGGGDLTADRTLSITQATTSTDGYLSSTDWNTFNNKQATLVSATNIKTINGSSILGSGDLVVTGSDPAGFTTIIKSANQDVTNSATLTDDTEIQFSVVTGGYYMVEMNLCYSGNDVVGDYKFAFALSTGTMRGGGAATSLGTGGGTILSGITANNAATTTTVPNGVAVASLDNLHSSFIQFNFWASANATFKFQFANNSAGAGRISRTNKGTYIKYKKIN